MQHSFKYTCYNKDYLLDGTKKLSTFMTKLKRQAQQNPDYFDPDKYFGDGFEALVEAIIVVLGKSHSIQIKDYTPIMEDDLGVDGIGYGPNMEPHTVQCKARSNTESFLTANNDHISNFVAHSHSKFGGDTKVKYMTIFTTASDLHHVTKEMYNNEVRVIGNKEIRRLVDNNEMFWQEFANYFKF